MTRENLVTVRAGVDRTEARRLLHKYRIEKLIVVDDDYRCVGLITVNDMEKAADHPLAAKDEHERLLATEERILGGLEIPYRVVDIPVGDLGAPAARKFDIEAWIPSQERYREVTSTSNTTDYQARRLNCRYRPEADASPLHVNTLNGTAVAVSRTLIAIMENRQEEDGSISVPPALVERGAPAKLG
jgi:seryl-tRNA synthetase